MNVKNLKFNGAGAIDLEWEHPEFGWIPFTASPDDPEAHGQDLYTRAVAGEFGGIAPYVAPPVVVVVPQQVTRFQGRAALYQAGLLDDIEAYMSLPTTDWIIKMAWEEALHFDRPSPMISSLKDLFGLTDSQIDDLFIFAKTIS